MEALFRTNKAAYNGRVCGFTRFLRWHVASTPSSGDSSKGRGGNGDWHGVSRGRAVPLLEQRQNVSIENLPSLQQLRTLALKMY